MPELKICGVTRREDLDACERLGVDAVGINLWRGSKRGLTPEAASSMLAGNHGPQRIGVFVERGPEEVRAIATQLGLDAIQYHGDADPVPYAALGVPWIWVLRGTPDVRTLRVPTPAPAWVLLDAAVSGFGGAGVTTDWTWAASAVRALAPLPVWLAGGIHPGNASDALSKVRPAGLDVASGAERSGAVGGEKDVVRIQALVSAVRSV